MGLTAVEAGGRSRRVCVPGYGGNPEEFGSGPGEATCTQQKQVRTAWAEYFPYSYSYLTCLSDGLPPYGVFELTLQVRCCRHRLAAGEAPADVRGGPTIPTGPVHQDRYFGNDLFTLITRAMGDRCVRKKTGM
jgi:hypothetical protein